MPRALEFKLMLRLIMLSRKGNHDIDYSVDTLEFVKIKKAAVKNGVDTAEDELPTHSLLSYHAPLVMMTCKCSRLSMQRGTSRIVSPRSLSYVTRAGSLSKQSLWSKMISF